MALRRGAGEFDEVVGVVDEMTWPDAYEIHYFGFCRPSFRTFRKDPQAQYRVEVIDTWNMTVTDMGVFSGKFRIPLPGREYMAVRIRRI